MTRDDLPDGAAAHFAEVIRAVRKVSPSTIIEVLASDLNEKAASIQTLMAARPHIFGHNLETVERLTPIVRFRAQYRRSLRVLKMALDCVNGKVATKSGIMLGLGETEDELFQSMDDLLEHGVTVLTLGQYLRPTRNHLPVVRYIHPDDFARYEEIARAKGFRHVASGPLVRSSYHAANFKPEADVLEAMRRDAATLIGNIRVDGGASANDFLLQFQSDILGIPLSRPLCVETTAWGAASLAAYCSKAQNSTKVPVDYTRIRFVKKPNGAKPGMVIFTNNYTVLVDPDEQLFARVEA